MAMASNMIVDDLWPDILRRVSCAKSLCRFRCVCRSWNSLLSSSEFIRDHSTTSTNKSYLLLSTSTLYNPRSQRFTNLHPPPLTQSSSFTVLDAINGVVCAACKDSAFLWTPSINNKYVRIPHSPSFSHGRWETGFGYDNSKTDFKLLKISLDGNGGCGVYSVQSGEWRSIKGPDSEILIHRGGVFINGGIHWVMRKPGGMSGILVFDCETEEWSTMEFPEEVRVYYHGEDITAFSSRVMRHSGMLALMYERKDGEYEVWGMEEYGVRTTWKKVILRVNGGEKLDGTTVIVMEDGGVEEDVVLPYELWRWRSDEGPLVGVVVRESMFITDPKLQMMNATAERVTPAEPVDTIARRFSKLGGQKKEAVKGKDEIRR